VPALVDSETPKNIATALSIGDIADLHRNGDSAFSMQSKIACFVVLLTFEMESRWGRGGMISCCKRRIVKNN
jgi:hypothetical protein